MSNHWHGVLTDPEARLPEFLETFHKLVAKAQNASLGLWSSDKTSIAQLISDNDVLDKMAYTLANALSDTELQARLREQVAKLVKRAREDMRLRDLPFVGRNAVLRQNVDAIPKSPALRRNPSPSIAAKSTPARVAAIRRMLEICEPIPQSLARVARWKPRHPFPARHLRSAHPRPRRLRASCAGVARARWRSRCATETHQTRPLVRAAVSASRQGTAG